MKTEKTQESYTTTATTTVNEEEEVMVTITPPYSRHPCSWLQFLLRACLGCLGLLRPANDVEEPEKIHKSSNLDPPTNGADDDGGGKKEDDDDDGSVTEPEASRGPTMPRPDLSRRPTRPKPDPGPGGQINFVLYQTSE